MRTIYGLRSRTDQVIRYIGQTGAALPKRLKGHVEAAKRRSNALHLWVAEEAAAVTLEIIPLREVENGVADQVERQMIAAGRASGHLLNVRDGWKGERDKTLIRPVLVEQDDNGTLLITCPSLPMVTTFAVHSGDIVRRANDAIETALLNSAA